MMRIYSIMIYIDHETLKLIFVIDKSKRKKIAEWIDIRKEFNI